MCKKFKRIAAGILSICMLLCLAVPVVSVHAAAETEEVYNFAYYSLSLSGKFGGTALYTKGQLGNCVTNIQNYYANKEMNWKYCDLEISSTGSNAVAFNTETGYVRVYSEENEWVAFTLRSPGAGTYAVSLNHSAAPSGAAEGQVHILSVAEADEGIKNAVCTDTLVGTVSYHDASTNDSGAPTSLKTTSLGIWTAEDAEEYVVVFKATEGASTSDNHAYMYIAQLTMTPQVASVTVDEKTTYYQTADEAVAAINAAKAGTVELLADITSTTDIILKSGVTLDLNGKTLDANVNDAAGTVIDRSGGAGKVKGATLNWVKNSTDTLVLVDGDYLRLAKYTLTKPENAVEEVQDENSVKFWFDVRFTNPASYGVIANGGSKFTVGASFLWNGETAGTADFDTDLSVEKWAGLMQTTPNLSFYVKIGGLDSASATGTLSVLPTVTGKLGSNSMEGLAYEVTAAQ